MAATIAPSTMSMVTLGDGTQVPRPVYITTMISLRAIANKNFEALYDLFEKCKNPAHQVAFYNNSMQILLNYELIDVNERVEDFVKSIVLNSVIEEGFSLKLIDLRSKL